MHFSNTSHPFTVLVFGTIFPAFLMACGLVSEDTKPKGLEERSLDSDIVLAGYTRTVYKTIEKPYSYSAEILVFNVIKGEEHVREVYKTRQPSALETALNRRLVNVSNFGDPSKCDADVKPGETYILLLDILASGELGARYDGVYGPAVVYSRDKETVLEAIGSSPWSEWSPCSGSCGGGIQQRKRQCDGTGRCSDDEGQQRTCNMFPCAGVLSVLDSARVHRSSLSPPGRPSAHRLLATDSWRSREEGVLFPRTFPWEFSLLATVRVRPSSSGGFVLRVLHSGSLQVGLYMSDIITLVLSDRENIRVSFVKSLFDDHWHQIAFSVRRSTVAFYLDCEYSGKLPLPGKIRPFGGQPATLVIGSTGEHELDAFQGDVEQLTISGSPDAAEKQCNSSTTPFYARIGFGAPRQELRSKSVGLFSMTQNDQRGDGVIDDEDYTEEGSGDDYDYKDSKNKKIPLKAETSSEKDETGNGDDGESDEDDDDDDESHESSETKKSPKVVVDSPSSDYRNKSKENAGKSFSLDDNSVISNDVIVDSELNNIRKSDKHSEIVKNEIDLGDHSEKSQKTMTLSNKIEKKINHIVKTVEHILNENTTLISRTNESVEISYPSEFIPLVETVSYNLTGMSEIGTSKKDMSHPEDQEEDDMDDGSGSQPEIRSAWSEWSPCSSSCGWGRRTRTLYCLDNGTDLRACADAAADRTQTQTCFPRLCAPPSTTTTAAPATTVVAFKNITLKRECPCQHGGFCTSPFRCTCPPGYHGSQCQYAKLSCRAECYNGGTCLPPMKCACAKGYFGNQCQYALCKPQCLNGGACIAPNTCRCKQGFVGNSCHKVICPQGCKNGGDCVAPNKCACRAGFAGKDCSQAYCDPMCQNGGECVKPYVCHCPVGTKGVFCEKFLCKPDCQNGGVCIGPGQCLCQKGYSGHSCEYAYCPGGCINGGKCGKTGKCVCPTGYSGVRCEIRKPCKFIEVKQPYKRGFKQKVATSVKVPCGAWDWKQCTKTKVHYETVYKTFYKTSFECEGSVSSKSDHLEKNRT